MDGTLTDDCLDFDEIKEEIGLGDSPVLEVLPTLEPEERERIEKVLHRWEAEGAAACALAAGCVELLEWVRERGIKSALITRNNKRSIETVLERHGLSFEVRLSRDCLNGKYKPDPEPLWHACERLGVDRADAWMVGDWKYDIEAGNAASIKTVWLDGGRERPFDAVPWKSVKDLHELRALLGALV